MGRHENTKRSVPPNTWRSNDYVKMTSFWRINDVIIIHYMMCLLGCSRTPYMGQKTRQSLVQLITRSAPNYCLNQWWLTNTHGDKFQWNMNQIQQFAHENISSKMSSVDIWRPFCLGLGVIMYENFREHQAHLLNVTPAISRLQGQIYTGAR